MPLAAETATADLTTAFVFLFVMIAVSFTAGYGVAHMRLTRRRDRD